MNETLLDTILSAAGTLIPAVLVNKGILGANYGNLITGLVTPVETLLASLRTNTTKTSDALAALAALQGTVAVLEATTNLPATVLTEVQNVGKDISAALTAYALAGQGYDSLLYGAIGEV